MRLWSILLFAALFIAACSRTECSLEKKNYECSGFSINEVLVDNVTLTVSEIRYQSEGLTIQGVLAEPKQGGKRPLLLYNHGGKTGLQSLDWINMLAQNGYVVLASEFRGEGGSEGEIEVVLGETTDALNLLECGKQLDSVDESSLGVIGFSHGGGITVQAMELSDDFKAGVEFWGATDIKKRFQNIKDQTDPVYPWVAAVGKPQGAIQDDLLKRSAIYCVDTITAPLLIFHGKQDRVMPYEYGEDLAAALRAAGREYEFVTYDSIGHAFERPDGSIDADIEADAMQKTVAWFDKYLK